MLQKVPVLILAFNRPEHVYKAIMTVQAYQPEKLYLACDGPRTGKKGDTELVYATQKCMLEAIDWPCDVKTLFRKENLGCAKAVYEAITWFFEQEEYGIIIEDDVIVGLDFFRFCEELLPRYANEDRIMEIAAQNHSMRKDIPNTFVYTQTSHCWGWATWKRAWKNMDMSMSATQTISISYLVKRLGMFRGMMWWWYFKSAYRHLETFNSWATRWYLSILSHDGLVICPGVNLAINIGTDGGAHYDKADVDPFINLKIECFEWPLEYNDSMIIDNDQSRYDKEDFYRVRMIGLKKKFTFWR